jgi:hypothetical protein
MEALKRVVALGTWLSLGAAAGGCGVSPAAGGGYDGTYECSGTTVTPAGTTSGTGTFACSNGSCADSTGAFTGTVDANGSFSGTDVVCQGCNPLPMSGQFSLTEPFTLSGSSGSVSATFVCECSGTCGGGGGGGGGGGTPPTVTSVQPANAYPGWTVQVVGDDFPTSTVGLSVTICGVDAPISATGLHAIIVTLPSVPPGPCDVTVTAPGGSSTMWGGLTVMAAVTRIATGLSSPTAIALDGTSVYWLDDAGTVSKVPKAGGAVTVLASGLVAPRDLAVDGTSVYWTESGKVRKVGVNGGPVASLAEGLSGPVGIAVDASGVYWADAGGVERTGLDGGAVATLSAADPAYGPPRDVALVGGTVYFSTGDAIRAVAAAGGPTSTLFADAFGAQFIAADAWNVYWTEYYVDHMGVRSVPVGGGAATEVLARGWNLAVDPDGIFVAVRDGASVVRVPLGGGTETYVAIQLPGPWGVATDATSVYWTEGGAGAGAIGKVPK